MNEQNGEKTVLNIDGHHFSLAINSGPALTYAVVSDGLKRQEKRVVAATISKLLARIPGELPDVKAIDFSVRGGTVSGVKYTYLEICEYVDDRPYTYELRLDGDVLVFVTTYTSTTVAI